MASESEWKSNVDWQRLQREKTLKTLETQEVMGEDFKRASTAAIKAATKTPDDAIEEMKTWLRTGVAPDGTRMITEETMQWFQDFYQVTRRADADSECLPPGSTVDNYYWTTPYLAHIGPMKLVMMHAQVNVNDGTHFPADRLRAETLFMKNLRLKAAKRAEVQRRQKEAFLSEVLAKRDRRKLERVVEPGHPLYTLPA